MLLTNAAITTIIETYQGFRNQFLEIYRKIQRVPF